ncbi:MAG TPA: aminoacyl-histidine dipeptidase [Deltaproteobacteria bacterium]|nr:aminoacyl-histidine dipeptidase [Deltaproteobacteria bacterium]
MNAIEGLKPERLWHYFEEISKIPRESKHEGMIREYIVRTAGRLGLRNVVDAAGNVVVYKPGTGSGGTVILQSHLDMVCEQNEGVSHDFRKDPIRLVRDDGWIHAEGTTLGADNGIGVAAMLAVMEDGTLVHPDLEFLFTIDEETGLTGANMLDAGLFTGRTLINLDSEEDGTLFIGCAGGKNTDISLDVSFEDAPAGLVPAAVKVTGLLGGHSGTDIHRGRGNAVKLLVRLLKGAAQILPYRLVDLSGGSKHNVIPREAFALILLKPEDFGRLEELARGMSGTFAAELSGIDDNVRVIVGQETLSERQAVSDSDAALILDLLHGLPHGVMQMNEARGNFVVTSTNLAICRMEGSRLYVLTNQRSAYRSSIEDVSEMAASIGRLAGAHVTKAHDYPAWRPDFQSRVLRISKEVYEGLFGRQPEVRVIHAGLECAVFGEKIPGLDMISLGPTIEQAHSPSERVLIGAVENMWVFLAGLLKRLARE